MLIAVLICHLVQLLHSVRTAALNVLATVAVIFVFLCDHIVCVRTLSLCSSYQLFVLNTVSGYFYLLQNGLIFNRHMAVFMLFVQGLNCSGRCGGSVKFTLVCNLDLTVIFILLSINRIKKVYINDRLIKTTDY